MTAALRLPTDLLERVRKCAGPSSKLGLIKRDLFPAQLAFVEDSSSSKAALCSRRAGKTHGICTWLYEGAELRPDGLSAFIGLSRAAARRTAWAAFKKLNRRYELGLSFAEQDGQLQVVHPNGHQIWLAGCSDSSEIDKFRGATDGFTRVVVDEAQAFGAFLQELIEDALEPALLDTNGQLALTGTPGAVCAGYFHAVTTGADDFEAWPTHHWTVLQNTAIPHATNWVEAKRKKHGWTDQHPTYRREWLGEWVNDAGALVYPMSRALNSYLELPDGEDWFYTLGVDLGFRDATAFVLVATQRGSGQLYVLAAEKRVGMLPQAIGARIMQYRERFRIGRVVMDEGGLGKGYAEQMRADGVPVEPAEKSTKRAAQEWLRGLLLAGAVKVHYTDARCLVDETSVLTWNEDGDKEDERFENHACDAFLYAARAALPIYRPERELPTVGTAEWFKAQQDSWKANRIREQAKNRRKESPAAMMRRLASR